MCSPSSLEVFQELPLHFLEFCWLESLAPTLRNAFVGLPAESLSFASDLINRGSANLPLLRGLGDSHRVIFQVIEDSELVLECQVVVRKPSHRCHDELIHTLQFCGRGALRRSKRQMAEHTAD